MTTATLISYLMFALCGALMAVMQSILTHDYFNALDVLFKTRWWGREAWQNKNDWKLFGKNCFRMWPFIIITDAFHLAHFLFVLCFSIAATIHNFSWLALVIVFAIYSTLFEIFYTYIFKEKNV